MSDSVADRLTTRRAGPADCRTIFGWANDPDTRAASFHSEPIAFAAHRRWYDESLQGDRRLLRIVELDGTPVALIRFDRDPEDPQAAEIGINVAPEQRGRGLAAPVLNRARRDAAASGFHRLVARIKRENERSIRAFERADFHFIRAERVRGFDAVRYETDCRHSRGIS